jgi:hypothetical protein
MNFEMRNFIFKKKKNQNKTLMFENYNLMDPMEWVARIDVQ